MKATCNLEEEAVEDRLMNTATGVTLCGIVPSMDVLIAAGAIAGMGGGGQVHKFRDIRRCPPMTSSVPAGS